MKYRKFCWMFFARLSNKSVANSTLILSHGCANNLHIDRSKKCSVIGDKLLLRSFYDQQCKNLKFFGMRP